MQLGLIKASTSDVIIETSLVSPVDTKQARKAVRYRTASVHTRTEWYDIVSFQFLAHFSVPPNFWTCFGTDCLIFFHTHVNATPHRATFWNGPKWNGRYRTRVNRASTRRQNNKSVKLWTRILIHGPLCDILMV